jgi:hypothetical protein
MTKRSTVDDNSDADRRLSQVTGQQMGDRRPKEDYRLVDCGQPTGSYH